MRQTLTENRAGNVIGMLSTAPFTTTLARSDEPTGALSALGGTRGSTPPDGTSGRDGSSVVSSSARLLLCGATRIEGSRQHDLKVGPEALEMDAVREAGERGFALDVIVRGEDGHMYEAAEQV